ncbi:MAG: hypothetical protein D6679_14330 [Candidatus Hydrogenedentota bacterium]|nr:MAG: hypothetical protein D6679_14330 [Candidatus Hydrogenedentota bacterium]
MLRRILEPDAPRIGECYTLPPLESKTRFRFCLAQTLVLLRLPVFPARLFGAVSKVGDERSAGIFPFSLLLALPSGYPVEGIPRWRSE